ncbi:MAG: hypothetical protein M1826_004803 [Phylliscum demangeonii]|nr:MAG: hypothetical protein M1826_004803 [Phylliscum demangeonii]
MDGDTGGKEFGAGDESAHFDADDEMSDAGPYEGQADGEQDDVQEDDAQETEELPVEESEQEVAEDGKEQVSEPDEDESSTDYRGKTYVYNEKTSSYDMQDSRDGEEECLPGLGEGKSARGFGSPHQAPEVSLPRLQAAPGRGETGTFRINFLEFPLQVRQRVYELLLSGFKELYIKRDLKATSGSSPFRCAKTDRLYPAILRTRKDVRDEALPVLYARNTFQIEGVGNVVPFFSALSSSARSYVQNVVIVQEQVAETPDYLDLLEWDHGTGELQFIYVRWTAAISYMRRALNLPDFAIDCELPLDRVRDQAEQMRDLVVRSPPRGWAWGAYFGVILHTETLGNGTAIVRWQISRRNDHKFALS